MKKVVSIVSCLLLIVFASGLVVVNSGTIRNFIFYKSGLTPKEVFSLNDEVNSIPPEDTSGKRVDLLKQIDDFAGKSVSGNSFTSDIYSLVKIRLDQALKEIPNTQVPKGKVKIWYIYNMGVIAKTSDKTIAFDLASTYVYSNMPDFTKYIDVLVITHFHNDHFDIPVVKEALKNGVTVIIPGDKMTLIGDQFVRDPNGEDAVSLIKKRDGINSDNLISLKPEEETVVKGMEITAYPAKHFYNDGQPVGDPNIALTPSDWYLVNLSGFTILHTGDAASFDYQPDFTGKNIDLFIIHDFDPRTNDSLVKLVPNAKVILPLHEWELQHGPGNIGNMNYKNILDDYSNGYYKTLQGKTRFIPMIWGESILF